MPDGKEKESGNTLHAEHDFSSSERKDKDSFDMENNRDSRVIC